MSDAWPASFLEARRGRPRPGAVQFGLLTFPLEPPREPHNSPRMNRYQSDRIGSKSTENPGFVGHSPALSPHRIGFESLTCSG